MVFGSMASGKAHTDRDIDLLASLVLRMRYPLYPLLLQLGREMDPKLNSKSAWSKALAEQSGFIPELLPKPLLMIFGDQDDLRQSDRQTT